MNARCGLCSPVGNGFRSPAVGPRELVAHFHCRGAYCPVAGELTMSSGVPWRVYSLTRRSEVRFQGQTGKAFARSEPFRMRTLEFGRTGHHEAVPPGVT